MIINSKGQTLIKLSKFKQFNIPKLKVYETALYKKNKEQILNDIHKNFKGKIAIRSSNIFEDKNSTKAGMFKSYLNVNSKDKIELNDKILEVIKSYKNFTSKYNEFFIYTFSV